MKLLSGTASIAKFLLTTFATVAALGIGLPSAAFAGAAAPPKTQSALGCLIGLEPDGCQKNFASAEAAWQSTTYCTEQYIHRGLDNCFDGPLETAEYLGTNTAGADVYVVKYMHTYTTYVIAPPAPDGKIHGFWIKRGLPIQVIPSSLVAIRSPAHQLLYSRPG